jgi:hypothetical protein
MLLDKINHYLTFIEEGEIYEKYPQALIDRFSYK